MKKWPLNSVTLFAATHSKLRKASDGTGTQIVTCMINKWTAKINKRGIYNGKCPLGEGGIEKRERKGRKTVAVLKTPESFRREAPKNREEVELILGQSPRINFYPFSTCSIIPFPYSHVPLLKLSLKLSSWARFLYQIYCIGPVGFGLIRPTIKNLPKVDPTYTIMFEFELFNSWTFT